MKKIDEKYFKDEKFPSVNLHSVDDELTNDEEILWRAKPMKSAYVWSNILKMLPLALLWLIIDTTFIVLLIINSGEIPSFIWFIIVPFFILHLAPVWIWIWNIIKANIEIKNIEYAFTNKRVIIRSGVIGVDFRNIYYTDIVSINLKVGLIDKLLKVGDIYLKAKNESVVLFDIKNPYVILKALQKISLDIKADIYFPNNLRSQVNSGYNTNYKLDKETSSILKEDDKS